ncbi:MAG: DUF481 domain-containing protein [Woeseiaceae bacterium]|nr:DUF481 domain-containing protein [Woeseiaceae bacterium]
MQKITVFALCALFAGGLAQAEEESPWSGKASLGYLATSGNTENSTLKSDFEIHYVKNKWEHSLTLKAIQASEENNTTAEAYDAGWKSEYNFSETDFLFGRLDWRKDRFSGYDTQFSQTAGYGRRVLETERQELNAEIGAGAKQSDLADGTTVEEFILRGGLNYRWVFSENAEFTQDLSVESGSDNTYLESISAVKANLIGEVSLVASFTVKNNSDVPAGNEKTDTFTAISLEYAF